MEESVAVPSPNLFKNLQSSCSNSWPWAEEEAVSSSSNVLTHLAHTQQHVEGMEAESLLQMVARVASVLGQSDSADLEVKGDRHAVF